VSPIKAQLETIFSGKIQEGKKEKDVVFTRQSKEDEEKAKAAAVKAIETAFLRKKAAEKVEHVEQPDLQETNSTTNDAGIPIPAKRQSIKTKENR